MGNTGTKIYRPVRQIQDIRKVLGVKGGTGKLCTSANINERSAHKPTNMQSYQMLTEEQRLSTNYSTYIGQYYNPITLIREVVAGLAWGYDKPQAPYYRQGDFAGYNHEATDWVKVEPQTDTISSDRSLAIDIYGNDDALPADLSALSDLLDFGFLSQYSITEINFGFLVRSSEFTESTTNCYYIPLTGILTIRDIVDNGRITIPANTFDSVGTWYMMPVFTTATYEQGTKVYINNTESVGGVWYPVPYSNISSIKVAQTVQDYPVDKYIDIYLSSANASITDRGLVTLSDVDVVISNSDTTTAYRVVISSATISSGVITGAFELEGGAANVAANSTTIASIQSSQVQFEVADPSLENIAIELEYYTDNYSSQRRTKYIYIELV